jgi:hypothetical protein
MFFYPLATDIRQKKVPLYHDANQFCSISLRKFCEIKVGHKIVLKSLFKCRMRARNTYLDLQVCCLCICDPRTVSCATSNVHGVKPKLSEQKYFIRKVEISSLDSDFVRISNQNTFLFKVVAHPTSIQMLTTEIVCCCTTVTKF